MIRFSLFVFIIFCSVSLLPQLHAQVVFSNLSDNPAMRDNDGSLEERNYISSQRVVLLAGDTQTICITRADLDLFDTLINVNPVNPDFEVRTDLNCITINALAGAPTGETNLTFQYITVSGFILNYTVYLEIVEPLSLPFFDDFSYNSKLPDPALWVDRNVFINNTMALEPPSVGVATFDGLNSNGTPYGGGFARADYLTSNYIDLSTVKQDEVVYLSYFLQPKGNTYNHQLRDSIEIEFKNKDGVWEKAASHKGIDPSNPSSYIPPFQQYSIVVDTSYRYEGFQFRFVNYNYRLGVYSTWHLDYVTMIVNQVPSLNLRDIAFISVPNKILKRYSAIPYKQLVGHETEELANTTEIQLNNHFLFEGENIIDNHLVIEELTTGTVILNKKLTDIKDQFEPPIGISKFSNPFDHTEIKAFLESVPAADLPLIFRTTYSYVQDQEPDDSTFQAENNIVQTETEVGYVMAYDDGTAELNIAAEANNSIKSQIAVKFHLNEGDTLRAVQFHFPRLFDDVSKQLFNIKVWIGDLNDEVADYTYQLQKPIYADGLFDTLQGFTTYPLVDDLQDSIAKPLYIPAGDYYIGWQQFTVSSTGQYVPVGFDRNYVGGEFLTFYKSSGDWQSLDQLSTSPLLKGIPMVRAKFQNSLLTSKTDNLKSINEINFYPNPTNGLISIDKTMKLPTGSRYIVYNAIGNKILSGNIEKDIDLSSFSGNLFYVHITGPDGSVLGLSKILKVN